MNKKSLSESDIKAKYITPALLKAGWDEQTQLGREIFFTDGRIYVKGKLTARGKRKFADYILFYKPNVPIAIIEAKNNEHSVKSGIQQALDYANILDIPFVFSSNGDGFYFHDKTATDNIIEKEISLDNFPKPSELWNKYKKYKGIYNKEIEKITTQNYFQDGSGRNPRYYQQIAVNRTIEAVAKGQNRIILVMATGTGKTYTAFQIIYRLWKSGAKKRILFLADRTSLIDQTARGDFRHFKDALTIIKKKKIDTAYNVYLALYQGLSDSKSEDAYKQFSPDFFDLIIIDECHRGSAKDDSKWREILEYFNKATHIGLTATPKETTKVSNMDYFGEPIYTYSLKQGIDDGFLAPYKVVKVTLDIDADGWRPPIDFLDKDGNPVEDRIYNRTDFDKNIVVEERRKIVASKITEFLKGYDRFAKSIVFCIDIEHAEGMRTALVNENSDLYKDNNKYIMQITGDNDEGKRELDNFINPSEPYPVIATTSKLMTTGVDAQTCKLIVLDSNIASGTEDESTVEVITDILDGEEIDFTGTIPYPELEGGGDIVAEPKSKIRIDGIQVKIVNERVQYLGSDGKIITESLKDYTKNNIVRHYQCLDNFLNCWNGAEKKEQIIEELEEQGIFFDALKNEVGKDFDPFDLICHVAFEAKPLTRKERADNVKKRNYFVKYGDKAQAVIKSLLDKYAEDGLLTIESTEVLKLDPLNKLGTPIELVKAFGNKQNYLMALKELELELYKKVG